MDRIEIRGEIVAVDIAERTCKIARVANGTSVVFFQPGHEKTILSFFQNHSENRVRIVGKGSANEIREIEVIQILSSWNSEKKHSSKTIENSIADLVADVPEEECSKIPVDLSLHLDRYLYGQLEK